MKKMHQAGDLRARVEVGVEGINQLHPCRTHRYVRHGSHGSSLLTRWHEAAIEPDASIGAPVDPRVSPAARCSWCSLDSLETSSASSAFLSSHDMIGGDAGRESASLSVG